MLLALVFVLPQFTEAGQTASPEVVIESTRHDFGEVFVGEELMHVFVVRNTGAAVLELSQTRILGIRRPTSIIPRLIPVKLGPANTAPG